MRLESALNIQIGKNLSRDESLRDRNSEYTTSDFECDGRLMTEPTDGGGDETSKLTKGDVVVSFLMQRVAVASVFSEGKEISQNYGRIQMDKTILLPQFLVFLLNDDELLRRQSNRLIQGSSVQSRWTASQLYTMEVSLPSLDQQQKIGDAYLLGKRLSVLYGERACLLNKKTIAVARRRMRELGYCI